MKAQLETWQHEVETALPTLDEPKSIDQLRVKYLGKRGLITLAVREIGKLPPAERPLLGKVANDVKAMIEQLIDHAVGQRILDRRPTVAELFHPSTHDLTA